jgi:hypothetical protein
LPYIVIGTGTKSMFPDAPQGVLNLVKSIRATRNEIGILVRIHPKDDNIRWDELRKELIALGVVFQNTVPNIPMDSGGFSYPEEFFYDLINTIRHAAVVINTSSSLTVDSAILDTPVISLCYDQEPDRRFPEGRSWMYNFSEHFMPLIDTGGVKVVYSDAECVEAINAYIENRGLDKEGRMEIAKMVGGPLDNNAGRRLATGVKELVEYSLGASVQ